jgi:hypothetical protein
MQAGAVVDLTFSLEHTTTLQPSQAVRVGFQELNLLFSKWETLACTSTLDPPILQLQPAPASATTTFHYRPFLHPSFPKAQQLRAITSGSSERALFAAGSSLKLTALSYEPRPTESSP